MPRIKDCAWKVSIEDIKARNYNLDFKNPNKENEDEILDISEVIGKLNISFDNAKNIMLKIDEVLNND